MAKDFADMEDSNRSDNPDIHSVSNPSRRRLMAATGAAGVFAQLVAGCAIPIDAGPARPGFKSVPPGVGDTLVVPEGYVAQVLAPWGEPVGMAGNMPAFRADAGNSAAEQAVQMGMHHDGLHFFRSRAAPIAVCSR